MKTLPAILLVGPSGSGKSTVARILECRNGWSQIASYTTREPRYEGELGHTFVSDADFDELTDLVAYTEYNGYRYCATARQIDENELYVVDVAGVETLVNNYRGPKEFIVVILWCDEQERFDRMKGRGDSTENVLKRLETDREMFDEVSWKLSDFVGEENVLLMDNMEAHDIAVAVEEHLHMRGYEWEPAIGF